MLDSIIVVDNVLVVQNNKVLLPNISFEVNWGQSIAIVGDHHSAKAKLLECIIGKSQFRGTLTIDDRYKSMVYVPSQHVFTNRSNINSFYYQQRYNSRDANDSYTIREVLIGEKEEIAKTVTFLGLEAHFDKPLVQLSNGENKKVQLAQALLKKPKILLLDHPFSGLDVKMRKSISDILQRLKDEGVIIIISTDQATIPSVVSHVLVIECDKDPSFVEFPKFDFTNKVEVVKRNYGALFRKNMPLFNTIVEFKNVNITYNGQKILDNLNWKVKAGDRWLIKGPNGSGKSTLLSLINGDNPHAFVKM